jgi:LacI family transcriptional regulator, galactose operon repressor
MGDRKPTRKRVTRDDVAARAGVTPSTVSYVINNGPRPVSTAARERVLKAIGELGYQPSDVARSLRSQRSMTLGLVIPNTANPFYAEVARAVEEVGFEHGYTVFLCHSSHLPERERRYAEMLRAKHVDGAIFHPTTADLEPLDLLSQAGIQAVVLERSVPGYHCFVADERHGGYLATQHLLGLGHRRIGCVVRTADQTSSTARVEGYRAAMAEVGLPLDERLITESDFGFAAGAAAAGRLLDLPDRPTALVTHNDIIAIGAIKAASDAGLRVPADLSVVGYDDIAQAAYAVPALTTIAYPKHRMGRAAAQLLLSLLAGEETLPTATIVLPVQLVVRGSTAPLAS